MVSAGPRFPFEERATAASPAEAVACASRVWAEGGNKGRLNGAGVQGP